MPPSTVKSQKNLTDELTKKMGDIQDSRVEDDIHAKAKTLGLRYLDLKMFPIDTNALFFLSEAEAREGNCAVIAKQGSTLTVAVADPNREETKAAIEALHLKGFTTNLVMTGPHGLANAWSRYAFQRTVDPHAQGIVSIDIEELAALQTQIQDFKDLKERITSLPITQVLTMLLAGALKIGASDIHFEPEEKSIRLRYRLDGGLTDVGEFSHAGYPDRLSRVKLNSGLKINIHQTPQDGRFTIRLRDKDIEVRVSILPDSYGEGIVMRILDPSSIRQKLEDLGLRPDMLVNIKRLLQKTTGAILTTGPTGSGKTTTLYAFVQAINTSDVKIITIEDPVEYHIAGINQTQVSESAGYTFAEGLRSIVRQDPDIILVGEIRDRETAEICMQAALTGHLVLSTVHTNDAAGTIPRLIDLGVRPVTLSPAINAAMAQRLVRRLCRKCRKEEVIHSTDLTLLQAHLQNLLSHLKLPELNASTHIYYPVGCMACNSTGYKGRIGVYELFEVDVEMQKLILTSPAVAQVHELAVKKGLTTLLQDDFIKVLEGHTSVDEAMRVIGE